MSTFNIVIPARFASERLPGKPLLDIHGVPMIVRVARQASRSGASEVVVATDDQRIFDVVAAAGLEVELTRVDHESGSDRVMEVVASRGWSDEEIVLNVQGDEPLIPPAVVRELAESMARDSRLAAATLREPVTARAELFDPNAVKVVCDTGGNALYFSRAPIPWGRHSFAEDVDEMPPGAHWWRHIGVYAYRVWALRRFVQLPPGRLEMLEALEQLRLLENGLPIAVVEASEAVPGGVDTPADLERVRALMSASESSR